VFVVKFVIAERARGNTNLGERNAGPRCIRLISLFFSVSPHWSFVLYFADLCVEKHGHPLGTEAGEPRVVLNVRTHGDKELSRLGKREEEIFQRME
jgi:hypothetical protein